MTLRRSDFELFPVYFILLRLLLRSLALLANHEHCANRQATHAHESDHPAHVTEEPCHVSPIRQLSFIAPLTNDRCHSDTLDPNEVFCEVHQIVEHIGTLAVLEPCSQCQWRLGGKIEKLLASGALGLK